MKCLAKWGLFLGGVLFGTAGVKILNSREAKKVYTHTTAAVLRAKDDVMTTVTSVRESAGDILADAKDLNAKRAADMEAKVIEDDACGQSCEAQDSCCACEETVASGSDAEVE